MALWPRVSPGLQVSRNGPRTSATTRHKKEEIKEGGGRPGNFRMRIVPSGRPDRNWRPWFWVGTHADCRDARQPSGFVATAGDREPIEGPSVVIAGGG